MSVTCTIIAACIGGILGGGLRLTAWALLIAIVVVGGLLLVLAIGQGIGWGSILSVVLTIYAMEVGYIAGAFVSHFST